jgi:hypothetical protein
MQQDRHYYLPSPGDRVVVRTDAEPVRGEVICFFKGTVTVRADDGHILMATKRRVSPQPLSDISGRCRGYAMLHS